MAIVLMSPKLGVEDLVFESGTILAVLTYAGMELPFSHLLNSLAHLVAKSGLFRANFRDVSFKPSIPAALLPSLVARLRI